MKHRNKWPAVLLATVLICMMTACGQAKIPLDYGDEAAFETDLNAGKDLVGKTVSFVAAELHPQSLSGYDIWAGEHLNFISAENPNIEVGETATVRVTDVVSALGSWLIRYEKVDAVADENTIYTVEAEATAEAEEAEQPRPLKIADHGYYIEPPYSGADSVYMHYCGIIHNPNKTLMASYPKITVTISNPDGTVIATGSQTGSSVMPEDTVTLIGMMRIPVGLITDETMSNMKLSVDDFVSANLKQIPRTTDFEISHVTEQPGSQNFITGTIANLTADTVDSVNLSMVMRQDGKIVFIENTFVDDLLPGEATAFQFDRYSAWPEHDTIEISAQVW